MKLSISNIAWDAADDAAMYAMMKECGYAGLEIAPTRIFPQNPYDRLAEAKEWREACGFVLPSMQSIWYGKNGNIFCDQQREELLEYTYKAIDFAAALNCRNLVFGCPKNRQIPHSGYRDVAVSFFREIAAYAAECGRVIGMEANPSIYNTNFINTTKEALELVKEVNSPGFLLNLDVGTMIYNGEDVDILSNNISRISHVHISEPYLKAIEERDIHNQLATVLKQGEYGGFVSIEMGRQTQLNDMRNIMEYVKGVFQ